MGILIDSSVLIDCERRRIHLDQIVVQYDDDELFISPVILSELLHGVHRARSTDVRTRRTAFVDNVAVRIVSLDVTSNTARVHAELWAELEQRGQMIGTHDTWIAASALEHDLALLTGNLEEFGRVDSLRVLAWKPEGES
jgi:tRNA(fMet)-specific endonuclease VapC